MNQQMQPAIQRSVEPQGGIDVVQTLRILWNRRKWIVVITSLCTLAGILNALLSPPVFYAYSTISLKEGDAGEGASRFLSQFIGMGSTTGANSVDKMEIVIKSHELAEAVIRRNNLLPVLFPKIWDAERKVWKRKPPNLWAGANLLRSGVLSAEANLRKDVIVVGANARTAANAKRIVDFYLFELREKIRVDVTRDADTERRYLEDQLERTTDPILAEKIQDMIAFQIEKSMLVSSQAFEILERPVKPRLRVSPNRKKIVVQFFIGGILLSVAAVFAWNGYVAFRRAWARGGYPAPANSKHTESA